MIKSPLDGWKNICVDIHNNQQFWIQEDGLEYTIFTNLFVLNYPHSEHFSTSSPEFSTFLGYHRGFKKCRHLRELQHFPQSRHPAASLVLHLWAVSNFLALKIPYQILGVFLPYQSWYFVDRSNSAYLQHSIVYIYKHSCPMSTLDFSLWVYLIYYMYYNTHTSLKMHRCNVVIIQSENTIIHRSFVQYFSD